MQVFGFSQDCWFQLCTAKFLFSRSIYSVGGSSGLEDFALHGIDSMGLRYEQALSFPESMNHSFDNDHLNFFDTDLQSAVDNFMSAHAIG